MNLNAHDFEYERRRKQLSDEQPVVGWNWPIVITTIMCAGLWGLILTFPTWLKWFSR